MSQESQKDQEVKFYS